MQEAEAAKLELAAEKKEIAAQLSAARVEVEASKKEVAGRVKDRVEVAVRV